MQIPKLNPSNRTREWNLYGFDERAQVVKEWLFSSKKKGHRQIDSEILKRDPAYTHGFQSMGILHFLGLKNEFHAIFEGMELPEAIKVMEADSQDFSKVLELLTTNIDIEGVLEKKVSSNDKQFKENYLESLAGLAQTDSFSKSSVGRKEQALLRVYLFGGKKEIECSLCHKNLPVNLMITAHIKPRKHCSHAERVDLSVVMPACKLGCDDLFEKGYLIVDIEGFIQTNPLKSYPQELDLYVAQYQGKKCTFHNKHSSKYFIEKNKILTKD